MGKRKYTDILEPLRGNYIALKATLIYLVLGFIWIFISDRLILMIIGRDSVGEITYFQTVKGVAFVVMTGMILFFVIKGIIYKTNFKLGRLKTLVDKSNQGLVQTDEHSNIVFVNNKVESLTGISRKELIGKNFEILIDNYFEDSEKTKILNGLAKRKNKKGGQNEFYYITPQGEKIWFLVNTVPILDKKGHYSGILSNLIDISDKVKSEKELEQLNKRLIKQNEDLQQFTYVISHNLRSPVTNIMGLLGIYNKNGDVNGENTKIVENLEKASISLDQTLRDLDSTLAIRNNDNEIKETVDLADVLDLTKENLNKQIKESNIEIITDFREGREVYAITGYVQNIFYNLLSNAIKYRDTGKSSKIWIRSMSKLPYFCVEFKDNGLGFDVEKNKDKLFGLYKRFHFHTEGKGLGLYLVRKQVESLGGKVEVASEINKGSTFRVYFKV